jgi:hypothetical protein
MSSFGRLENGKAFETEHKVTIRAENLSQEDISNSRLDFLVPSDDEIKG